MVAATNRTLKMTSLEMRTKLGLTQLAWARALNVSYNTVNSWENWGKPPKGLSTEVLNGIAAALEATPEAEHAAMGRRIALGLGALITFGLQDLRWLGAVDKHPDNVRISDDELALLIDDTDDAKLHADARTLARKLRLVLAHRRVRAERLSRAKSTTSG